MCSCKLATDHGISKNVDWENISMILYRSCKLSIDEILKQLIQLCWKKSQFIHEML